MEIRPAISCFLASINSLWPFDASAQIALTTGNLLSFVAGAKWPISFLKHQFRTTIRNPKLEESWVPNSIWFSLKRLRGCFLVPWNRVRVTLLALMGRNPVVHFFALGFQLLWWKSSTQKPKKTHWSFISQCLWAYFVDKPFPAIHPNKQISPSRCCRCWSPWHSQNAQITNSKVIEGGFSVSPRSEENLN